MHMHPEALTSLRVFLLYLQVSIINSFIILHVFLLLCAGFFDSSSFLQDFR